MPGSKATAGDWGCPNPEQVPGQPSSDAGAAIGPAARYFAGDWAAFARHVEETGLAGTYDVILTAETIYEAEGSRKLLHCIDKVRHT